MIEQCEKHGAYSVFCRECDFEAVNPPPMTDQHPEADPFADAAPMSKRNAKLVQRVYEEEGRRGFYRTAARQFPATLDRLLDAARKEGAARPGVDRDRLATLIGSWIVSGDTLSDEYEVIHDQFAGDYDQRTAALYLLTDAILALGEPVSGASASPSGLPPLVKPILDGWRPIAEAPYACHVLAARFEGDWGEWIYGVEMSPPIYPFTHWQPLPAPPVGTVETAKGGA